VLQLRTPSADAVSPRELRAGEIEQRSPAADDLARLRDEVAA